jgi:hypothetical protein
VPGIEKPHKKPEKAQQYLVKPPKQKCEKPSKLNASRGKNTPYASARHVHVVYWLHG